MSGCKGEKERMDCLNSLIETNQKSIEYEQMLTAISDSITVWANKGLKNTSAYLNENSEWKVEAFLFNEDSSKIFGWILRIDKEKVTDIPAQSDRDDILDFVDFFSGENINGQWHYYIHNMPKKWFARKENNNKSYSFYQLSTFAKQEVIKGGLLKNNSCAINYNYINGWISRDGRNMYEWHKSFLISTEK